VSRLALALLCVAAPAWAETSAQMLARVDTAIASGEAVFIMGGFNDCAQGVPLDTITTNLTAIVTRVQDAGRVAVLLGTVPGGQPAVALGFLDQTRGEAGAGRAVRSRHTHRLGAPTRSWRRHSREQCAVSVAQNRE
jgi:hypothetical protein